jgi:alginate O-acetyltransferase complex protein AlgI
MIFNSFSFLLFFTIFFACYWAFSKNLKLQNGILLLGSCIFYAWADWRFPVLLFGLSTIIFLLAIRMEKLTNPAQKKLLFLLGLFLSVGTLCLFKYLNFFIGSFTYLLSLFGARADLRLIHIIIPLGISFFTFRLLNYLFDVNSGKLKPEKNWVIFLNFVSFFPCLLSGPIDKAKMFIPQLERPRIFSYSTGVNAMRQILWGLFKKVVIADRCAEYANSVFDDYSHYPGSTLALAACVFTFQIYADFSGYSDMAIGISRLLGFNVTKNFDFPLFSRNIAEFWRKWNISLTAWLTEYIFTPLSISFRDFGKSGLILAIVISFTICGIWHGPSWNYVLFGFIHGCYFIPLIIKGTMFKKKKLVRDSMFPTPSQLLNMLLTFTLVTLAFIVFRCDTLTDALAYFKRLFSRSLLSNPQMPAEVLSLMAALLVIDWLGKNHEYAIEYIGAKQGKALRWSLYLIILLAIFLYQGKPQAFIYFKF